VQVNPWAHAAIRAYLYGEWVANGQAGVRADLNSDLWAYYGNTCGDGDYDGINEYVSALTMDAAAKLSVTARAEILTKQVYNNSWPIYETSHKFWDLASSTALQPIFNPADPTTTGPSTVRLQMRPCWPYSDNVAYRLSWGDLTPVQSFSAPAKTLTSKSHTYTTAGIKTLSLTAVSDAKGRQINRSRSASVRVVPGSTQGPLGPFDQFAMN
jgi:hypothetical protein